MMKLIEINQKISISIKICFFIYKLYIIYIIKLYIIMIILLKKYNIIFLITL
jgi:hypothetical protein